MFLGPPPFKPQKFQDPLFDMKTMGEPHRKLYKLNFPRKMCGYHFQDPP